MEKLSNNKRLPYWDNLKAVLIALVVFGHCLYGFSDKSLIRYIVESIYFFHMPAFVFVSGFFSKGKDSNKARSLLRLISAYLILTSVNLVLALVYNHNLLITEPYNSLWYLLALIAWRIITPFFSKTKWSILFFTILALLAGLWSDINNQFAFSRIISLYPFFLAGFFFSNQKSEKLIQLPFIKRTSIGIACFAIAIIVAFFAAKNLHLKLDDFIFDAYSRSIIMQSLGRISIFVVASFCITGLLLLIPQGNVLLLTKIGKNSLAIFLIHRPITLIIDMFIGTFTIKMVLCYAVVFTIISCIVFGSNFVSTYLNRILSYFSDVFLHLGDTSYVLWKKLIVVMLILSLFTMPLVNEIIR